MKRFLSLGGILMFVLVSACGTGPPVQRTAAPASPIPPAVPTQIPASPTPEGPKVEHWTATADFGSFAFDIDPEGQMVMGAFAAPTGFSCGSSKISGTSLEAFDINTKFAGSNPFGVAPQKNVPVAFPVTGEIFTAGPFWVGTRTPVGDMPVAFMQMTLEGRFDSDIKASGQYTAYFVKSPQTTDLADTPCTGTFDAELTSLAAMAGAPTSPSLVTEGMPAPARTTMAPAAPFTATAYGTPPAALPAAAGSQTEQARAFAGPILNAIAGRQPDIAEDFSSAAPGWSFGNKKDEAVFRDGVAVLAVTDGDVSLGHEGLTRRDFVLQADGRVVAGDPYTNLIVNFHNRSSANWYYLSMNIGSLSWTVDKRLNDQSSNLASGQGIISPLGEWTHIAIVARGTEGAVYLNGIPSAYFNDPDFDVKGYTLLFCEARGGGRRGVCEWDNVKLWDLTNVSGLP